jgi:hypothetical protein
MTWDALLIGKAIFTSLTGLSGISTRVYPMRIPQEIDLSTTAAISYYAISTVPEPVKDSRSMVDTLRIQVSIFSTSYSSVNTIAGLVREELDGLSGEIGTTSIDSMMYSGEFDMYEEEAKVYHKAQEYSCRVKNDASVNIDATLPVGPVSVAADYFWAGVIPAGYMLETLLFDETTGHAPILSCGTTAGGNDIFTSESLQAGAFTSVYVNKVWSKLTATSIYIHDGGVGDTWNSAGLNIYAILKKII